jgi:phage terminase large subunit-like protein
VLPEPRPIRAFRPFPASSDLYVIHLAENTLERAVLSYEGGDPEGSISNNPSLTRNGSTVAFTSSASNLIFGDANQISDAFTATLRTPVGTAASSVEVNRIEGGFSLSASVAPELGLHVKRGKDGGLILLVETPGAGMLTAQIHATIAIKVGKRRRKERVVLGHAMGAARAEGTTTLVLRPASRYAKDLKRAGKLKALVLVTFTPPPPGEALSTEASTTLASATVRRAGH